MENDDLTQWKIDNGWIDPYESEPVHEPDTDPLWLLVVKDNIPQIIIIIYVILALTGVVK